MLWHTALQSGSLCSLILALFFFIITAQLQYKQKSGLATLQGLGHSSPAQET